MLIHTNVKSWCTSNYIAHGTSISHDTKEKIINLDIKLKNGYDIFIDKIKDCYDKNILLVNKCILLLNWLLYY